MSFVIVGAGLAGASAVEELRDQGYDGDVVLVGAEAHLPYHRPPLSKEVLLGAKEADDTDVHDAAWYAERDVDVRTGTSARRIDRERRVVETDAGEIGYDRLLLATGSEPRRLEVADTPTSYLRTRDDARALRAALLEGPRVLVVGAGWIGLEGAAAARAAGCEVTVVEPQAQPLLSVMGEQVGAAFAGLHREHGVDLRLGTPFDGTLPVPADLVLVAVGAEPRLDLARDAGLEVDGGVLVDASLRTSDPLIVAAGDIAAHDHPVLGRLRVEHWDNAIEQGKAAARTMLGGSDPYVRAPYFFTDQYDLGMEYVGHVPREHLDSVVVRGDLAARQAVVFWHDGGRVLGAMHLNEWDAIDEMRSLVGQTVDPDQLSRRTT
ncbi:pyridine nucleotide-disulfide oxidoreductase [Nocardioides sp. Root1257]|uniref:NAD(P)/FAD-dependent oxidoreductase n=1 Tax=unclassified Nocardioides TaxID=2615069 RepID=UPI0006F9F42F|nr:MULTISPECIES: FAD-dependent oxidoreductase [unclassified Nocardioides]KQW53413.1 pyridine nucleotide-disulfide oxidoreductase [Nocardioides sp. Root1257]KRC56099.1 pyridine nucleotide-disulfide oxidoreductase [Nocardioides sp. Root224]